MPADVRVYNRRRLQVEAVQLTADADWEAIAEWCGGSRTVRWANKLDGGKQAYDLIVFRQNGVTEMAAQGDWIVKDQQGFYVVDELDGDFEPIAQDA